ncbi:MAG: hypothetical protein ACLFU8_06230 [Anaerolineales bacterium]
MSKGTRVVKVGTLRAFETEVDHGSVVRLMSSSQSESAFDRMLYLDLYGVTRDDEIVWLHRQVRIMTGTNGEPLDGKSRAVNEQWSTYGQMVRVYLKTLGYEVRTDTSYGISQDILPYNGHFECVAWDPQGQRYVWADGYHTAEVQDELRKQERLDAGA